MEFANMITAEKLVEDHKSKVWEPQPMESGAKTFLTTNCIIDLRPGGAYEMYFDLDAQLGFHGGEGCQKLAIQSMQMLSIY